VAQRLASRLYDIWPLTFSFWYAGTFSESIGQVSWYQGHWAMFKVMTTNWQCCCVAAAFVPGVALYRAIETSTCLSDMSQNDCHSQHICWRHDLDHYRYATHGFTAACLTVAVLLLAGALAVSPPDDGAVDLDSPPPPAATSRRRSGGPVDALGGPRLSTSEPRTPAVYSDVIPPVNQSLERTGSVYNTPL